MKRIYFLILTVLLLQTMTTFAAEPEIKAESAIVMDASHNILLYEKNTTQQIQPGSLTKIMTAIITIEQAENLNTPITADAGVIAGYDFSFGNMGVLAGETLTTKDLLYGMMVYNAGEAAEVLAHSLTDSYDTFLNLMNQKAAELGAASTHFTNASGYYDPEQVTTVSDLARISAYAMQNQTFKDIVSTKQYEIPANSHYKQTRHLPNTNQMLLSTSYYYPAVNGIKTSYMKDFGYSLSISAQKGDTKLICIVANSPVSESNSAYADAKTLLNHGFENFSTVRLISKGDIIDEIAVPNGKGVSHVLLAAANHLDVGLPKGYQPEELNRLISKNTNVSAPIKAGQTLGSLSVSYQGNEMASVDLCAYQAIDIDYSKDILNKCKWVATSPFLWIPILGFLLFFIIRMIVINYQTTFRS